MMKKFDSVDAALEFAIHREQEAFDLYHGLAAQATDPQLITLFTSFAKVEAGHKQKLQGIKEGETYLTDRKTPLNLKISEYMVEVVAAADMSFQDALILAMKREQAATALYTNLAQTVEEASLQELFSQLAKEESAHKARFENLYEENFMSEN